MSDVICDNNNAWFLSHFYDKVTDGDWCAAQSLLDIMNICTVSYVLKFSDDSTFYATTNKPTPSFFTDWMPFMLLNRVKALNGNILLILYDRVKISGGVGGLDPRWKAANPHCKHRIKKLGGSGFDPPSSDSCESTY